MMRAVVLSSAKAAAYGVLDACTGGRGVARRFNGECVRFPARWFRYYPSDYEPATFAFLRERLSAGQTAIDIGAHIGLFTVLMARLVGPAGRVFSFEPTESTRRVLHDTVRLNGCEQIVDVRSEAVAAACGRRVFFQSSIPGSNSNSLAPYPEAIELPVETVSVDAFVGSSGVSVDCLKIDAEGAELEILRGGVHVMMSSRPHIALALHPDALARAGGSLSEIWELLDACGMDVSVSGARITPTTFCTQTGLFDVHATPRAR